MRVTTVSVTLALVVAPVAICEQVATAPESASTRSRAFLDAWLHHIPGAETGKITPVDDEAMRRILPDDGFFTVRFTRYPRAQLAPPPLKLENLIAVKRDGTVEQIENLLALQRMLSLELPAIRDESEARAAVLACGTQEVVQARDSDPRPTRLGRDWTTRTDGLHRASGIPDGPATRGQQHPSRRPYARGLDDRSSPRSQAWCRRPRCSSAPQPGFYRSCRRGKQIQNIFGDRDGSA